MDNKTTDKKNKEIEIKKLIKEIALDNKENWNKKFKENIGNWNLNEEFTKDIDDVTDLKVHKILYFLYGFYYKEFKKELFIPNFHSYKHGPVEISYKRNNIFYINISENEEFIRKFIFRLMTFNVWELVERSHFTTPWKEAGAGKIYDSPMKNKSIQKYFKGLS